MSLNKENLNNFLPNGFETENKDGYKTNFSNDKIATGYEKDVADIVSGPNLNNFIDKTGKNFNTLNKYVGYLNDMPINKMPITNASNQLDYIDNNFLTKNQITNCILEAPNGVATYSGSSVTIKQGLKVLIPNGRNADGTLKNIEYTVNSDITSSIVSSLVDYRYVFLTSSGTLRSYRNFDIYFTDERPTRDTTRSQVWFDKTNNKWYRAEYSTTEWISDSFVPIAFCYWNTTTISDFKEIQPINLLKISDKSQISGWGMPSSKYIDLQLGASGTTYTAPANGWFRASVLSSSNSVSSLSLATSHRALSTSFCYTSGQALGGMVPVAKNETLTVVYTNATTRYLQFTYAEGSNN